MRKVLGMVILMTCLLTGCAGTGTKPTTAVGSSALQPLVEAAGEKLMKQDPKAYINVQGGGSGTGLSQVQQGAVAIGNSDVFAEQKKGINASKLRDYKVCVVAIVPVVNRQVGVRNLSLAQLQAIFMGRITNWRQVGGPNLAITVINRSPGSGTRMVFDQQVMRGQPLKPAPEQDSSGMVRQIVKNTPGAISYLAWPYLTSDLQSLKINQVSLTVTNVAQNRWPIWAYEHMYVPRQTTPTTQALIKLILSDDFQESTVRKMRYIPIKWMQYEQDARGHSWRR
ncbi:phosphate ABC transporter substrate-binding protein PstS family protein [Lactobacillus sp. DCY120]|uniref:Phosphate-binding protein n=1 Tax=Bombilactobacillus apium TaxID=2675299 RepID=A0A850QYC3_9LACO|nr:phosphate ABC transporter substrate-binding protein PstS family protein [Bombilactobacillus apium]NVY96834.1 phosphate ABC transporter substrate-binding protein PstS family protein [Bombilactobacillus apium]